MPRARVSDYAGNRVQKVLRWGADRLMPGNQLGANGTLVNEGRGLVGLGMQLGGALLPIPGGSLIGRQAGTNFANNGNPLDFAGNDTRLGGLVDQAQQWLAAVNGGRGAGGSIPVRGITNLPPVVSGPLASGSWEGLGTSTGNLFHGGSLGSWAAPGGGRAVNPLAAGIGRGGAGVISSTAAQDYLAAMKMGEFANRQSNNAAF